MSKEIKIIKKGNDWKIDTIQVSKGTDIIWICDETDFAVWFPQGRDPLEILTENKSSNRKYKRKIKEDAQKGEYEYSVFCYSNNKMAEGVESSPKMIID